jgi:CheY-like chemotaxis protein
MALQKPIVVVDDDVDDRELIESIFEDLGVSEKRVYFSKCADAFAYLTATTEQPLIIICDINLPLQNGVDFKKQIDADPYLRQKSIPFVFLSTSASKPIIDIAYSELVVQGFFEKESNMKEFRNTISTMIAYWKCCKHPNS